MMHFNYQTAPAKWSNRISQLKWWQLFQLQDTRWSVLSRVAFDPSKCRTVCNARRANWIKNDYEWMIEDYRSSKQCSYTFHWPMATNQTRKEKWEEWNTLQRNENIVKKRTMKVTQVCAHKTFVFFWLCFAWNNWFSFLMIRYSYHVLFSIILEHYFYRVIYVCRESQDTFSIECELCWFFFLSEFVVLTRTHFSFRKFSFHDEWWMNLCLFSRTVIR